MSTTKNRVAEDFKGYVGRTWQDSEPWWPEPQRAREGSPNILVVLFDNRTTLGLVRLKMRQTVINLTQLFEQVFARPAGASTPNILAGADDEIDKLFQ